MRRLHLFEFEDQNWFPSSVREAMTDYLSFMSGFADVPFSGFVERLNGAMIATGDDRLVDLASGAGGPAITIARLLRGKRDARVTVTLTDLYPNLPRLDRHQHHHRPTRRRRPGAAPARHRVRGRRGRKQRRRAARNRCRIAWFRRHPSPQSTTRQRDQHQWSLLTILDPPGSST